MTDREQKLIDATFEIAMVIHFKPECFQDHDTESLAKWIRRQLRGLGFHTAPVGCSWGVLMSKEQAAKIEREEELNKKYGWGCPDNSDHLNSLNVDDMFDPDMYGG